MFIHRSRTKWVAGAALALAVLLIAGLLLGRGVGRALAAGGETGSTGDAGSIAVTGQATIKARPDTVGVTLGVETYGDTATEAASQCSTVMNRVIAAIAGAGVPRENIQTANLSLWPQYDYSEGKGYGRITGYQASNQITLSWNKLDKIGEVIDKAIQAGANRVSGISFSLADSRALYLEAVGEAVRDARAKADALAAAAGVRVGGVKNMSLDSYFSGPIVMQEALADVTGAGAPPVEPGQVEMQVTVRVEYGID